MIVIVIVVAFVVGIVLARSIHLKDVFFDEIQVMD